MQNLPVILAVILAAAAIIAVLFWRIKTLPVVNTEAADKRVAEETERARALQAKLDAGEVALRDALMAASTAKANIAAADARAGVAEASAGQARADLTELQEKYQAAGPQVAAVTEQKKAAEEARAEVLQRFEALGNDHKALQLDAAQTAERATKAEKDTAASKSEAEAVRQRMEASDVKLNEITVKLDAALVDLSVTKSLAAEATAQRTAADTARADAEERAASLVVKHDALTEEHKAALTGAASATKQAENVHIRSGEVLAAYEAITQELDTAKRELIEAAAKQQSSEDSTRQFENISQAVLKDVLEEAKRSVGEMAARFEKSSGAELEKHADKITRTLEPLQAQLTAYDAAVESLKKGTQENYGSLREQLSELQKTERSLHDQAKALTTALSGGPKVKGAYGEMILKQLVEFVGMQEKCHFETQASRETEQGRRIPDLVVSLPGGQKVLVDAKAVMEACVQAYQTQDDDHRTILLRKHCDNVRARVLDLSSKNYFENHKNAVEAVVLFLPAENLYATALENDVELTEFAMKRNIIICGPNSLMMLLKVANQLWRRASIEEEAQKIKECGDSIYKFACDFIGKYAKLGTKIRQLEDDYNDAAGTLDGRLIPKGREMGKLTAVANGREMESVPLLRDDIHEYRSAEAKKQIVAAMQKLPELVAGDKAAELVFSTGTSE